MGTWADLPTELVIQVLEEIYPPETFLNDSIFPDGDYIAQEDLLNCNCVSRQFQAIIEPILYRDVHLMAFFDDLEREDAMSYSSIRQFTRTIVLRPQLGKHVRRLFVPSVGHEWDEFKATLASWKKSISEAKVKKALSRDEKGQSDLSIILAALKPLGLKNGLVLNGGVDGMFITLLHLLPKLQSLYIEASAPLNFVAHSCFGAFGGQIPASLRSIVELSVYIEEDPYSDGGLDTEEVAAFMTLPSLQTLTVCNFYGGDAERLDIGVSAPALPPSSSSNNPATPQPTPFVKIPRGYALPAHSSHITTLRLKSSSASCKTISNLLKLPLRLETFEYQLSSDTDDPAIFNASDLLPGIIRHAASLKELIITADEPDHYWDEDEPFIGSLYGMIALEKLHVSLPIILDGAQWFDRYNESDSEDSEDDDDDSEDEETQDEDEDQAVEGRSSHPTISNHRNPMDDLLPPNLTLLELAVDEDSFPEFIKRTGIPQSLVYTRQRIPSLVKLLVTGEADDLDTFDDLLTKVPMLEPLMSVSLFDISSEN
ncbi:hypothetical protein DL93DRAFT_1679514 [Clavulina sp. PMI_390]|nr:hypothetical protein DL93DRAFT_1679514 [Clavulina sp. PMI_390]